MAISIFSNCTQRDHVPAAYAGALLDDDSDTIGLFVTLGAVAAVLIAGKMQSRKIGGDDNPYPHDQTRSRPRVRQLRSPLP
jgi:hypothetical protein